VSERIEDLPVAVIGGGPVGLAAAAQLVARGVPMRVYEAGETVAANVRSWGHVRLFSFWRYNMDEAAKGLLREHGWQEPQEDGLPTGHELCDAYLEPLAEIPAIGGAIETRTRVRAITRQGIDKVTSPNRARHPFALMVENQKGARIDLARAVIDASGTWQNQNPLGAAGIPAHGEAGQRAIVYGIPDILGRARADYTGKRVLVIGGGHSAANALLDLARLAETDHGLQLTWVVRGTNLARVFGGGADDRLPARGKLGSDLRQLVDGGRLQLVKGFHAEEVTNDRGALVVAGRLLSGRLILGPVDRIIVATGQRPDLDMTRELRLDFDPWLESARALGPSIDPNLHSCGSVPPHGYRELAHPDPGYFSVGIKSYGRAPTFLLATGHEQVRSVVAHLAGDEAAAIDVQLTLPETGVCSTDIDATGVECCGAPAPANAKSCCLAAAPALQE
jgi:thioredoxin reductase